MKASPIRPSTPGPSHPALAAGLLLLAAALAGCSDDTSPTRDGQAASLDYGVYPDSGYPAHCDKECLSEAPYLCRMDSTAKRCIECERDEDCAKNPGAMGDKCDTKYKVCTCGGDADCAGKLHGSKCLPNITQMCGCSGDGDCREPDRCLGTLFGARVCARPCRSEADCNDPALPRCDVSNGMCVACFVDKDCTAAAAPYCNPTLGKCVACAQDSHCSAKAAPVCDTARGVCGECAADADCAQAGMWGGRCVLDSQSVRRCRCAADADCKDNLNGPTCNPSVNKCTCTKAADCTTSPSTICALPYLNASYMGCQQPCQENNDCGQGLVCHKDSSTCVECKRDADCLSTTHDICHDSLLRCVACRTDADCDADNPRCDPASGKCGACRTDAHCAASPDGAHCDGGQCTCRDDKDCSGSSYPWGSRCITDLMIASKRCGCKNPGDCAGNPNGPTCFTGMSKCSCAKAADCTVSPYENCWNAYPGAEYKYCQKSCTSDADCGGTVSPRCNTTSGKCVECTEASQCAGNVWAKLCNTGSNKCVECVTAKDCTAQSLGAICIPTSGLCQCTKDADCAANTHGHLCHKTYFACYCEAATDCAAGQTCEKDNLGIKLCK